MSKINNLTEALKSFKEKPSETIAKVLEEIRKNDRYADLGDIGREVAAAIMNGHYHGSDLYDDMSEDQIKEYLSLDTIGGGGGDDESYDEDSSDSFDRWDYIQEIRDKFASEYFAKLQDSLEPILKAESFKRFHSVAIAIPGLEELSAEDLALALRSDGDFLSDMHQFLTTMNG